MAYEYEDFLWDVMNEAIALKESATPKEIQRLSLLQLNPFSTYSCIYGQMTGSCMSSRASELIFKCCTRYVHNRQTISYFDAVSRNVNGPVIEGVTNVAELKNARGGGPWYFSAIEAYIMMRDANLAGLITFLKGETETLEL